MQALDVNEQLYALQQELLWQGSVVIQVSLNTPGGYTLYPWESMMSTARSAVEKMLEDQGTTTGKEVCLNTATGPYTLFTLQADSYAVKRNLVAVEESHSQGRLWDLDVITAEGAIDRAALGLPPRQCLLCSHPAHECRKLARHHLPEVVVAAQQIARGEGRSEK